MTADGRAIAVVGLACRYPEADDPQALWDTVVSGGRAFRRIPPTRLDARDYWSADPTAPDRTYASHAGLLQGFRFDRERFRVAGSSFRSADLTHWLALDVAAAALADAGLERPSERERDRTGVIIGNTLTGEFSRATTMRLRWPYVRRVVDAGLEEQGWSADRRAAFLQTLEASYKAPFPAVGAETLAGGLSNTIAGRICNQFDLHGGGYTVDAACAASLLAVITACNSLLSGDLDVALAGGVDLSLDPFELVGFAKAGALAHGDMTVYDRRADGFWPGEGCGILVLVRLEDARARGHHVHGVLRGWGVSSDGSGGLTRPEAAGQRLALDRAYHRAGLDPGSVPLFEGHGTGTAVGDGTELSVLQALLGEAGAPPRSAAVGSVKANIGHTKAAAGAAGLIKAIMAVSEEVIPPHVSAAEPAAALTAADSPLRLATEPEPWPRNRPVRAGVSAMGFGGINTHVVVERLQPRVRLALSPRHRRLARRHQGPEVFLFAGATRDELRAAIAQVEVVAGHMAHSDLPGLALGLARRLGKGPLRAAVVAAAPAELGPRLRSLLAALADVPVEGPSRLAAGVRWGEPDRPPRVGLLFSGQGSPTSRDGGRWRRQYPAVARRYADRPLPATADDGDTRLAQPAIVRASLAGLWLLERLGVSAVGAVGHSLGEVTALRWAGALTDDEVERLVDTRASLMGSLPRGDGAMVAVAASAERAAALAEDLGVCVAAVNADEQTTVAGQVSDIEVFCKQARAEGIQLTPLRVSHAFHSPQMEPVQAALRHAAAPLGVRPARRPVWSTVTGGRLGDRVDVADHVAAQLTTTVAFLPALRGLARDCDVLVEVGPGRVLANLAARSVDLPIAALDSGGADLRGLADTVAVLHTTGASLDVEVLFEDRDVQELDPAHRPSFLASPCSQAPDARRPATHTPVVTDDTTDGTTVERHVPPADTPAGPELLEVVRVAVARHIELPADTVHDGDRLLSDLHLSSIAVAQISTEVAAAQGFAPPAVPAELSDVTVGGLAAVLGHRAADDTGGAAAAVPAGAASWVRSFVTRWDPAETPVSESVTAWAVHAAAEDELARALRDACPASDHGPLPVVVRVPHSPTVGVWSVLHGAAMPLVRRGEGHLVLVQTGHSAAAFARTVHLEHPAIATTVVTVPDDPASVALVRAEVGAADGHREVRYGVDGARREPVLVPWQPAPGDRRPLGSDDLVLVTGGGKGIGAQAALHLGATSGTRIALVGRSDPERDAEVAAILAQAARDGLRCSYHQVDITDAGAVRREVSRIRDEHGPITGLVHAAGHNRPASLDHLDEEAWQATVGPKVLGLRHVLAALDPATLCLVVAFGSIIGRCGLEGQADYAVANEWLAEEVAAFGQRHRHCRCLTVDWSVWADVGMGARLGVVETLAARGVNAIPPEEGLAAFERLVADDATPSEVVVTGRFGPPPTVRLGDTSLPLLRWVERVLVHYPGVELVVEAEVGSDSDPYLADHVLDGVTLVPGVMGMEAMAQVAAALAGTETITALDGVEFLRPVTVPAEGSRTLRIAAVADDDGTTLVTVRSDETSYAVEHFHALVRTGPPLPPPRRPLREAPVATSAELYGVRLFHGQAFQRVAGYRQLTARRCVAEVDAHHDQPWFGRVQPDRLLLGDPGARDAAVHAVQACIPQRRLLPVSVDAVTLFKPVTGRVVAVADEVEQRGQVHTYDVDVVTTDGVVCERWSRLALHEIGPLPAPTWPDPLLGPYLEREWRTRLPGSPRAAAARVPPGETRRRATDLSLGRITDGQVARLQNGRPVAADVMLAAAHTSDGVLVTASPRRHGCDVERVGSRPARVWEGILGRERWTLARELAATESLTIDQAATAVWVARECLLKLGRPEHEPLALGAWDGRWGQLTGGRAQVCIWLGEDTDAPIIGVATDGRRSPRA